MKQLVGNGSTIFGRPQMEILCGLLCIKLTSHHHHWLSFTMIKYNAGGVNDNNRELTLSDNNLHIKPTAAILFTVYLLL